MNREQRALIERLLDAHRVMTLATLRPDGWPQATTVGYVNDGLTLYFLCGPMSQKAANLARDDRVSLTIDDDPDDVLAIKGLSMAARAAPVTDPAIVTRMLERLVTRYPPQPLLPKMPPDQAVRLYRVVPKIISLLDYSKGFGHTDLLLC